MGEWGGEKAFHIAAKRPWILMAAKRWRRKKARRRAGRTSAADIVRGGGGGGGGRGGWQTLRCNERGARRKIQSVSGSGSGGENVLKTCLRRLKRREAAPGRRHFSPLVMGRSPANRFWESAPWRADSWLGTESENRSIHIQSLSDLAEIYNLFSWRFCVTEKCQIKLIWETLNAAFCLFCKFVF